MNFFKSLWTDLVDKRLWPVALVLLLALVAVPVALGGAGDDASVSAPVGTTGATGAESAVADPAQIALDASIPARRDRAGAVRDPFKQREVATGATGTTGIPAAPAQSSTQPPSTGGGTTTPTVPTIPTAPPGPTGPNPPQPKVPAPDPLDSYAVSVRFGEWNVKRARRTIERLTPMPSAEPILVFLGVLPDKKTAVFLLRSDVRSAGEGVCKPRKSGCQVVELRRGESQIFDVTADDGTVTRYLLDLLKVTKTENKDASSRAVAARTAAATSRLKIATSWAKAARKVGVANAFGSARYSYDDATGLLRRGP